MMEEPFLVEFKKNCCYRLNEGQRMIHIALAKVAENDLWKVPVDHGMALGNQLLHCSGNMTQYIISSLGENIDKRERDLEFSTDRGFNKIELLEKLDKTITESKLVINKATKNQFIEYRKVQGFELSGLGVVLHAVEHFSYHVGQIAFWVKQLTKSDLGFYDDRNLNVK